MKPHFQTGLIIVMTAGLYVLFFFFNQPVDFNTCELCDGKQYLKLYWYFENGTVSQITYPFYTRPIIPLMASIIPGQNPFTAFHIVNAFFIILSIFVIRELWKYLKIKFYLQLVGFGWLLIHWTGIIRYNLFDFITVDVPVYFTQALALILFYRRRFKWFYLLAPLSILSKESFIGVLFVLLIVHIWNERKYWFKEGQHLLYTLLVGIGFQYLILQLLPSQNHQWHPLLTIGLTAKMTIDDPTRLIRWFAAFGSAFGIIPLAIFNMKSNFFKERENMPLISLSILYCGFGLLAGEDMTRILFLGFPFIMTISLLSYQLESKAILIIAILLSIISLRFWSLPIQNKWGVDYRELSYVYQWTIYFAIAALIFGLVFWMSRKKLLRN